MKKILSFIVLFLSLGAYSETELTTTYVDLSAKMGVVFGEVTTEAGGVSSPTPKTYGGVPVALGVNLDALYWLTLGLQAHIVADLVNSSTNRQGIDVNLAFHLLGGSRRRVTDLGYVAFVMENPYNLSLLVRTGFQNYSVASKTNPNDRIDGSVYETMVGIQFRYDVWKSSGLVVEAIRSAFSLPTSSEKLKPANYQFDLSWRFYL